MYFESFVFILGDISVFPAGSHCASQPCQNGGVCYDFSSADAYFCHCFYSYTGLHCQIQEQSCGSPLCGDRTSEMLPMCVGYTSDKALRYTCKCYITNSSSITYGIALNNCYSEQLFFSQHVSKLYSEASLNQFQRERQ